MAFVSREWPNMVCVGPTPAPQLHWGKERRKREKRKVGGRRKRNQRPGSWLATSVGHCLKAGFVSRMLGVANVNASPPGWCHRAWFCSALEVPLELSVF